MRRLGITLPAALLGLLLAAAPALACGGLIGPNGAVNLLRTTTFAGYHDGEEHYVTAFQFAGGGGAFGSITPLPGHPERGRQGRRLDAPAPRPRDRPRSTSSPPKPSARPRRPRWCRGAHEGPHRRPRRHRPPGRRRRHRRSGPRTTASASRPTPPRCSTSTPSRSPIFLAAAFDADAAAERGQQLGDGTPVHVTIPTDNPWVPLRILALGKTGEERVEADVLPAHRHGPGAAAGAGRRQRHPARPQRRRDDLAARRPAERPRHGVDPVRRLAHQGRGRRGRREPVV